MPGSHFLHYFSHWVWWMCWLLQSALWCSSLWLCVMAPGSWLEMLWMNEWSTKLAIREWLYDFCLFITDLTRWNMCMTKIKMKLTQPKGKGRFFCTSVSDGQWNEDGGLCVFSSPSISKCSSKTTYRVRNQQPLQWHQWHSTYRLLHFVCYTHRHTHKLILL